MPIVRRTFRTSRASTKTPKTPYSVAIRYPHTTSVSSAASVVQEEIAQLKAELAKRTGSDVWPEVCLGNGGVRRAECDCLRDRRLRIQTYVVNSRMRSRPNCIKKRSIAFADERRRKVIGAFKSAALALRNPFRISLRCRIPQALHEKRDASVAEKERCASALQAQERDLRHQTRRLEHGRLEQKALEEKIRDMESKVVDALCMTLHVALVDSLGSPRRCQSDRQDRTSRTADRKDEGATGAEGRRRTRTSEAPRSSGRRPSPR